MVRLSRAVSCRFCTCVGRVGLGRVMVSEALCAVGFLLVGWVIKFLITSILYWSGHILS